MRFDNLISIIVPVYNVEDYIGKCVESIFRQTYSNLEIILVDDGSTDKSGELCDTYSIRDSRVRVVHKENGGLSDARNAGIDVATGDYYIFIDSDDYVHPQFVEELVAAITGTGSQIAVCDYMSVSKDQVIKTQDTLDAQISVITDNTERLNYFYGDKYVLFIVAWNKLYPAEFFRDIRYPKGKIHEDEFTTYKLLEKADKIAYVDSKLYYYLRRENSIMGEKFTIKRLDLLEAFEERIEYYRNAGRYDWLEKVLFMFRIFLVRFTKEIAESTDIDSLVIEPHMVFYKKIIFNCLHKLPVRLKAKAGYLYFAVMPERYMKNR